MDLVTFAMVIGVMVLGNAICVLLLNKKRNALDLTKPDEAKRAKNLTLVCYLLPIETIAISVFLYVTLIGSPI